MKKKYCLDNNYQMAEASFTDDSINSHPSIFAIRKMQLHLVSNCKINSEINCE